MSFYIVMFSLMLIKTHPVLCTAYFVAETVMFVMLRRREGVSLKPILWTVPLVYAARFFVGLITLYVTLSIDFNLSGAGSLWGAGSVLVFVAASLAVTGVGYYFRTRWKIVWYAAAAASGVLLAMSSWVLFSLGEH